MLLFGWPSYPDELNYTRYGLNTAPWLGFRGLVGVWICPRISARCSAIDPAVIRPVSELGLALATKHWLSANVDLVGCVREYEIIKSRLFHIMKYIYKKNYLSTRAYNKVNIL